MAELSAKQFLSLVCKSKLLTKEQLAPVVDKLNKNVARNALTAALVGENLINEELLTPWQVKQLQAGKTNGFFLRNHKILDLLGQGGMGAVFLALHRYTKRQEAIKVLTPANAANEGFVERFLVEARATVALNHPNIVKVYDIGEEKGLYYQAMEYLEGCDLQEYARYSKRPIEKIVDYIRQAALGLAHAHQHNLIHRDVKPANLFLDEAGVVKVLDLGLAKCDSVMGVGVEPDDPKTILGTPDYIAPEQTRTSVVDGRADVYSLGCTLYFLLTRKVMFPEGTVIDRIRAHRSEEPKPISELRKDVPASLVAIWQTMTAKDPEDRYQTMNEVAEVLEDWLANHDNEQEGGASSSDGLVTRSGILDINPLSSVELHGLPSTIHFDRSQYDGSSGSLSAQSSAIKKKSRNWLARFWKRKKRVSGAQGQSGSNLRGSTNKVLAGKRRSARVAAWKEWLAGLNLTKKDWIVIGSCAAVLLLVLILLLVFVVM